MTRITKIAALSAATVAAVIGTAAGANAATYNPDGTGFIGKGEVQSAFGFNNGALQNAVDGKGFAFRTTQAASQPLTQGLSQSAEQVGTQNGTEHGTQTVTQHNEQDVFQTLTCEKTTGNDEQRFRTGTRTADRSADRSVERDASRTAEREGSRTGTRTGTRAGTLSGSLDAVIDAQARRTGQWTGWKVMKTTHAPYAATPGSESFNALPANLIGSYDYGTWVLDDADWVGTGAWGNFGSYQMPAYQWSTPTFSGDFTAADGPNSDPNGVCVVGKNNVTKVTLTTTYGAEDEDPEVFLDPSSTGFTADSDEVAEGHITDGPVTVIPDSITSGTWSAYGPVTTFAKNLNAPPAPMAGIEKRLG